MLIHQEADLEKVADLSPLGLNDEGHHWSGEDLFWCQLVEHGD